MGPGIIIVSKSVPVLRPTCHWGGGGRGAGGAGGKGGESIARSRAPGQVPSGDVSPSSANIMGRLGKPTPSATTHSHSHVDLPVVVLYSALIKILVR